MTLSGNIFAHKVTWDDDQSFTLNMVPEFSKMMKADDRDNWTNGKLRFTDLDQAKNYSQDLAKSLCHTLARVKQKTLLETKEILFKNFNDDKATNTKQIEYKAKCILNS